MTAMAAIDAMMKWRLLMLVAALLAGACASAPPALSDAQSTVAVSAALTGKSRLDVEKYFGRKPDKDLQTTQIYRGNFYTPGENNTWSTAVVVFSHFDPNQVWSVAFSN